MIKSAICTIGDELLIGQVTDTNAPFIAQELNRIGVIVTQIRSVGDQLEAILEAIDTLLQTADLVVLTGGLGPTRDDITKNALAQYTQADLPDTCTVLENRLGTAPGMWFDFKGKVIVSLPGVPYEMEGIFPLVIQAILKRFSTQLIPIIHRNIATFGTPESVLAEKIAGWERALPPELHLAYLPNPVSGVRLRLSTYDAVQGADLIEQAIQTLKPILGDTIYSTRGESLAEIIASLLIEKEATLAVAESCTGGKVSLLITSVIGASKYYTGSILAYDNKIKEEILGVDRAILEQEGAVSAACVEAMATGAQKLLGTHYAVATSGIAGPSGGSPEKPVGTAWIAVATPFGCTSQKFLFSGDRLRNIDRISASALNMLRITIIKAPFYEK